MSLWKPGRCWVRSSSTFVFCLRRGLSGNLEHVRVSSLAGQRAPETCLSPLEPALGAHKRPGFCCVQWGPELSSSHFCSNACRLGHFRNVVKERKAIF